MVIVTRYALVLAVLMLFALPGAAQASTASVDLVDVTPEGDHSDRNYEAHVQYTADAGEVNQATLSFAAGSVTVKDTGAAISVSDGCRLVDKHTAVCRTTQRDAPLTGASAELGDGADRARLTSSRPFSWHVSGGAGDDLIDGSRVRYGMEAGGNTGEDTLIGGPGQDNLAGNDGADTLLGGSGDDTLTGDGVDGTPAPQRPAPDLLDGGPGRDEANYSDRRTPVVVDLARGVGGSRGENDRLVGVEDVFGGRARDVLSGDEGPNTLTGAGGYTGNHGDILAGHGGNDILVSDGGASRLDGGAGDDRLIQLSGDEKLRCGSGRDTVDANGQVLVPSDCERIDTFGFALSRPLARGGLVRTLAVNYVGAEGLDDTSCGAALTLRAIAHGRRAGALLGRIRWRWGRRGNRARIPLAIQLTRVGRRAARRHATAVVKAVEHDYCFSPPRTDPQAIDNIADLVSEFRVRL